MVSPDVWFDKLPEDKVKYYNKTRMSMELFSFKLGLTEQWEKARKPLKILGKTGVMR